MPSVKCPNGVAYQSISLDDLGQGCVVAPALVVGYLYSAIERIKPVDGLIGNPVLALDIGVSIVLGMFILNLVHFYQVKCERCGYVSTVGKKRER